MDPPPRAPNQHPSHHQHPPLHGPPMPNVCRVEAKRRKRRARKQTRRRQIEEEADALLVACIQAHDHAPPVLNLPAEIGFEPQVISEWNVFMHHKGLNLKKRKAKIVREFM